jgi:hypothetical protein
LRVLDGGLSRAAIQQDEGFIGSKHRLREK